MVGYPTTPAPSQRPSRKLSDARAACTGGPCSCCALSMAVAYGLEADPARQSRSTSSAQQPAIAAHTTVRTVALMSASIPAVYGRACQRARSRAERHRRLGERSDPGQVRVQAMASGSLVIKITAGKKEPE